VREGRPMASVDVLEDARVGLDAELRHRLQGSGHAAALAAPLVTGRGVTGVLVVRDDRGRRFTEDDISIAAAFADQAAAVLENARLYRRAKDRAEKLRALSTLTQRITSATHSQAAFGALADAAVKLLDARLAQVWVRENARGSLHLRGSFGRPAGP